MAKRTKDYGPWTYIKDKRPPEYEMVLFCCIYENGNSCRAIGYRTGNKYEIEWTDDHPDVADIMFWMPITTDPIGFLRVDAQKARKRHDQGLMP